MRPSSAAAGILALASLALLAGCDAPPPGFTNNVDEERLAALVAEPLFAGGTARVGGDPNTSANVDFARGEVFRGDAPWRITSGGEQDDPWGFSVSMLSDVRANGWTVTRVECTVDDSGVFVGASLIALKELDGFTAALEGVTEEGGGARLTGLVPYHGESVNPWLPSEELALGTSCLESSEAPAESSALGGESNLERGVLLPPS